MAGGSVSNHRSNHRRRADRILDAAADLVIRWGYKRVTIEEVAKRAGIGKGTIYLHWKTREALFLAVMARDAARLTGQIIQAMREDPAEILLHRLVRRTFLSMKDHPLLQAMFTRDTEVLGDLVGEGSGAPLRGQKLGFAHEHFGLLQSRGLLRTDMTEDAQIYAINATVLGFYLLDPLSPEEQRMPIEEKAELAAQVVRNAFEPPGPPDPEALRALAPTIIAGLERMRDHYAQFAEGTPAATRGSPEE